MMNKTLLTAGCMAVLCVVFHFADLSSAPTKDSERKKREPWTTSKITGSLEPPPPYRIERVFSHLQLTNPTVLTNAPGSDLLFVAELKGKISSFPADPAKKQVDLFFDMKKHIKGMRQVYGLTFHPDFKKNRYCYICYVLGDKQPDGTRLSRFTVTKNSPPQVVPESEQILLTWLSGGHNGGCLKFGPDGYLYVSTGDAGPAFPPDPLKTGQDVSDLPGSILRIDVDKPSGSKAYSVPKGNPFVGLPSARPEVWAYGLRNPWKMSFDPVTKALWVGDVGWELWEMIYRVERGGNYGWSLVEGPQEVHRERKRGPTPILPPTTSHSHTESRSITGGFVYRGKRLKDLYGSYIYGDYVTGKIWGLWQNGTKVIKRTELAQTPLQIIAFGENNDHELYIVGYNGTIYRLVPNENQSANLKFPRKLSETGLFSSVKQQVPAAGVIPYSIQVEPWEDHAKAKRWVAIPGLQQIGIHEKNEVWMGRIQGEWAFPRDSVLVKTLSLEMEQGKPSSLRRLETQILHHDGVTWQGYSYIWNEQQTDAILAEGNGTDRTFTVLDRSAPGGKRQQTWHFASRTECLLCHTTRSGSIQGFKPDQLGEQRAHLETIGLFEKPWAKTVTPMPRLSDNSVEFEDRARAYLHVNCAHCHRRGGGGTAAMELPRHLPMKRTNMVDARPTQGTFAIHSAKVVAGGDPYRSVLYYRMAKLGPGRMPHFGSSVVDRNGIELIHNWIQSLPPEEQGAPRSLREQQRKWLAQLTGDRAKEAIQGLLESPSGALMLMREVDRWGAKSRLARDVVDAIDSDTASHIRDLFERFLPADKRVKRLGNAIDPIAILKRKGSAERGEQLFFKSESLQCRNCHRIGTEGGEVGPKLDGIGKKLDRSALLESLLKPSKRIEPEFVSYLLETKKGRVLHGLLIRKNEKEVVLRDAKGKDIPVPSKEVDLLTPQQQSLMPELLLRDLTAQQAADLLAFLASLKR